jgi:spore germination protein GerM
VHRAGRTRSRKKKGKAGGSGFLKSLAGPVGLVAIGLGVILGAGWWAQHAPAQETVAPVSEQQATGGSAAQQPGAPQPSATQPQPPKAQPAQAPTPEPVKPKDPNEAILEARKHIDRSGKAAAMNLTIYYVDGLKNGDTLQPVEIRLPQSLAYIKAVADQVINAPADLKLYSSVPAGAHVLSVDLRAGVAVVDMSPEIAQVRGSAATQNIMAALVYSLTELKGVNAVQLWVNGRPAMLDQLEWSKPVSRADLQARNLFKVAPVIAYSPKP